MARRRNGSTGSRRVIERAIRTAATRSARTTCRAGGGDYGWLRRPKRRRATGADLPVDHDAVFRALDLARMAGLDDHEVALATRHRRAVLHAIDDRTLDDVLVMECGTVVHAAHARLGVLFPAPARLEARTPDDVVADLDGLGHAVPVVLL